MNNTQQSGRWKKHPINHKGPAKAFIPIYSQKAAKSVNSPSKPLRFSFNQMNYNSLQWEDLMEKMD